MKENTESMFDYLWIPIIFLLMTVCVNLHSLIVLVYKRNQFDIRKHEENVQILATFLIYEEYRVI